MPGRGPASDGDKAATIGMVGQLGTASGTSGKVPLVIDLDGTLLKTDLQDECALQLARRDPGAVFQILYWLARGRVAFRQFVVRGARPRSRERRRAGISSPGRRASTLPAGRSFSPPPTRVLRASVAARFRFIDEIIATTMKEMPPAAPGRTSCASGFPAVTSMRVARSRIWPCGGARAESCSSTRRVRWSARHGPSGSRWRCFRAMR